MPTGLASTEHRFVDVHWPKTETPSAGWAYGSGLLVYAGYHP